MSEYLALDQRYDDIKIIGHHHGGDVRHPTAPPIFDPSLHRLAYSIAVNYIIVVHSCILVRLGLGMNEIVSSMVFITIIIIVIIGAIVIDIVIIGMIRFFVIIFISLNLVTVGKGESVVGEATSCKDMHSVHNFQGHREGCPMVSI